MLTGFHFEKPRLVTVCSVASPFSVLWCDSGSLRTCEDLKRMRFTLFLCVGCVRNDIAKELD